MFQPRLFALVLLLTFVLLQINHALSQSTPEISFPLHQVSIRLLAEDEQKFGDGHICSGSLISPFTILTSASCLLKSDDSGDFYGASELRVVLGSQTRTVEDEKGSYMTGVTQVQTHGRFHKRTYLNNIAVLKVDLSDLKWGTDFFIAPMLTSRNRIRNDISCVVHGWVSKEGDLTDDLRTSIVFTKMREECNKDDNFPFATFCSAEEKNSPNLDECVGEEGAGLICTFEGSTELHGIVSRDCKGGITQYTDVSQVFNWIALAHLNETMKMIDSEFLKHFVFSALDFAAYYINNPKIADDFEVLKFIF